MSRLYTTTRWRRGRIYFLQRNPLCVMCKRGGRVSAARVVDHVVPHKGDELLFFDQANWQALCFTCHNSRKQGIERHGYDVAVDPLTGLYLDPKHPSNVR